jgi:hypothetical protein
MLWKKEPNIKYTEMCMYIDENVTKIVNPGEYPDIEDKIYNYLWLLVKALAIKKCMFQNFQDYDPFAFHAANRLFFALRKNQLNQGKIIKGKEIRPIKSCLNYTKALLYPMKVEYQNEAYREIISEEFVSKKFDAINFKEKMKMNIKSSQDVNHWFWEYVKDSLKNSDQLLEKVLAKSPFNKNSLEYKKLKMSIMLNCINLLKTRKKLDTDPTTIILWKLPKSLSNYVRVLLREFFMELKLDIMECYRAVDIDENIMESLLTAEGDMNYEEQY